MPCLQTSQLNVDAYPCDVDWRQWKDPASSKLLMENPNLSGLLFPIPGTTITWKKREKLVKNIESEVFKREVILERVWGNDVIVGGRTIDVHIRKLREKIGDDYFKTVKGVGYKFTIQ